ncbi:IS3 family transposase [Streptosporangium sp. NPDC004631]
MVSQSWLSKWRDRRPGIRRRRRDRLDAAIIAVFDASGGTYGSPRIVCDPRGHGWWVSVNTVAARMAALGLVARVRRPAHVTGHRHHRMISATATTR